MGTDMAGMDTPGIRTRECRHAQESAADSSGSDSGFHRCGISQRRSDTIRTPFLMQKTSYNIADTAAFAREFLAGLSPRLRSGQATIVGLYGDLGSGKTSFVQQIAQALGVTGSVQSPTFVLIKNYKIKNYKNFTTLVHIDAYRLENGADLEKLGWRDLAANPANLILIEWADRVADILPTDARKIYFEYKDDTTRKIALQ